MTEKPLEMEWKVVGDAARDGTRHLTQLQKQCSVTVLHFLTVLLYPVLQLNFTFGHIGKLEL